MINVKDPPFNAVGDGVKDLSGNYHDDFDAFDRALDWLRTHPPFDANVGDPSSGLYQGAQRLYIPAGHYYLSKTLDIKGISLIIEGESCGGPWGHATVLRWPKLTTGIRIQQHDTDNGTPKEQNITQGADSTILRNLSFISDGGISAGTGEALWTHGIHARARFVAEDISVKGFAHSGIFINASGIVKVPDPTRGNVNCFALSRVVTTGNGVAGLWVEGNDANAGTVTHFSSTENGQYGIYDKSFLGNTYVGCHTAGNGQQHSQVSKGGNRYHVFYGQHDKASTTEPGTAPNVWRLVGLDNVAAPAPEWARGTEYLSGGAYVSVNNVAENVFIGCYSEAGQPASYLNFPALVLGGAHGARIYGGDPTFASTPGIASVLAPGPVGLSVRPGIITESTDGASKVETTVGCLADGTFLKFYHSEAAPEEWIHKARHNNLVLQYGTSDSFAAYLITGPKSSLTFGPRAPIPHAFYTPNLVISGMNNNGVPDSPNARRVTCFPQIDPNNEEAPTDLTVGNWARGDFCFNSLPAEKGLLGWSCTKSSIAKRPAEPGKPAQAYIPATWTPVRISERVAAQAHSSATDLATLKSDFNSLLDKMRDAGILE